MVNQKEYENRVQDNEKVIAPHLNFFRDTSLIIGLVSLMGYLVAYNYQKGFRSFYNIDDTFISNITLTEVIISVAAILGVSVAILNLYPVIKNLFVFNREKKFVSIRYIVKYWVFTPILICILLVLFLESSVPTLVYIMILYFLLVALPNLIASFFNEGNNWDEKFKKTIFSSEYNFKDVIKFNILESTKGFLIGLFVAFILIGSIANLIGYSKAVKKDEYYVIEHNNRTHIIIDNYNENLIIAPFNKEKNQIISSFQIIESKSTLEKPLKLNVVKFKNNPTVTDPSKW